MGRLKGSINKTLSSRGLISTLSPADRVNFLANLIIDKIIEDEKNGRPLLKKLQMNTYGT